MKLIKIHLPVFIIILLNIYILNAQTLKGIIVNEKNEVLPYANVYIKGTTIGTSTNFSGEFELYLSKGTHEITFRFLGYKKSYKTVNTAELPKILTVKLEPENIRIKEVVITPGDEDPAYAIIRKAIEKRKYHLKQIKEYTCNSYTKGIMNMDEAPDSIFGESVHQKDDSLKGIIYLSESESKLFFKQPNELKEEMISSRVSGDNKGFSFNFISFFLLNFYENNINLPIDGTGRGFISPISSNALFYYRYRLEGVFYSDGLMVNKIKVIPKRKSDPVFSGYIYIIEDSWRIHSNDLRVTKDVQLDFIDSVRVTQNLISLNDSIWVNFSQQFQFFFTFNFFGAKFRGNGIFHSQFTNYVFKSYASEKFKDNEKLIVDKDANKKDSLFWLEKRPIPLTIDETKNYKRKDSLEVIYNTKEYKDSIDKELNKFKIINLLMGYTYYKSYDSTSLSINSILNDYHFNTVQGGNLNLHLKYEKKLRNEKFYNFSPFISYGFSNKKASFKLATSYFYSRKKFSTIKLEGGNFISQFNENNPISPFVNTLYSLLREENYMKLYEKSFLKVSHSSEIKNGVFAKFNIEYAKRNALLNTSNYSWDGKLERTYTSNDPLDPLNFAKAFETHEALIVQATFRLRYKQKYMSLPYKTIMGSKYPDLYISYKKGIPDLLGSDINFDLLEFKITDDIKLGLAGESKYIVKFGKFLTKKHIEFIDFRHFNANRTIFANTRLDAFQLLDYYTFSTSNEYIESHYEHHFNGFLINKIPLLRKTKFRTVGGFHFLYNNENKEYFELSLGLKNIFKLGRFDFVTSFTKNRHLRTGFVLRVPFSANNGSIEVTL